MRWPGPVPRVCRGFAPRCVGPLPPPRVPGPRCLSSDAVAALQAPTFSISCSPAGRGNEPPRDWPHAIVCATGRGPVSAVRWRVTARAAATLASHLLPAPGRRARAWPPLPAGGASAGAALGKEAVERTPAAEGGAVNLEQMRPDSQSPSSGLRGRALLRAHAPLLVSS